LAFTGWGIAVFGTEAINLLTPSAYHRAVVVLPWFVVSMFMVVLYQIWSDAVLFSKKTGRLLLITLCSAAANVILNLIFIPKYGIIAAAINGTIANTILAFCSYLLSRWTYPIPHQYGRWFKVVAVAAILGIIAICAPFSYPWSILFKLALILLWPIMLYLFHFWMNRELEHIKNFMTLSWLR
jgi:O-antigen/teichoic acid export membrane protein